MDRKEKKNNRTHTFVFGPNENSAVLFYVWEESDQPHKERLHNKAPDFSIMNSIFHIFFLSLLSCVFQPMTE